MLLLRAFPLSFLILVRFILVLPLWTLFYFVLVVISLVIAWAGFSAGSVVGIFTYIFVVFVGVATASIIVMHPYLVGIRIGLRSLGINAVSSLRWMLATAVFLGVIEALLSFAILITIDTVSDFFTNGMQAFLDIASPTQIPDPMAYLAEQLSSPNIAVTAVISALAIMALRAALLPAMAGVAAGNDRDGRLYNPVNGLGASFFTMMLLLLMIVGISAVVMPFLGGAARYVGLTSVLSNQLEKMVLFLLGDASWSFSIKLTLYAIGALLFSLWLFCLQCAGAALIYERITRLDPKRKAVEEQKEKSVDLAELRKSRM